MFTLSRVLPLIITMLPLLYSCGNEGVVSEGGTGGISFSLKWETPAGKELTSPAKLAPASAPVDCSAIGVSTIEMNIYDAGGNKLAGDTFACSAHQGTVNGVPVGTNRKVSFDGRDSSGNIQYHGETAGITVQKDTTANAGTVAMVYSPSGPLSGVWTGTLTASGNSQFQYTMTLSQKGSQVYGTSKIQSGSNYAVMDIGGSVSGTSFQFAESAILEDYSPSWTWCIKSGTLTLTSGSSYALSGNWSQTGCNSGTISLTRSSQTTDTTSPNNLTSSDFINSASTTTSSTIVTISIAASDDTGITAYYASESSTKPLADAVGWTSVTYAKSYSSNAGLTLSAGDGIKTIYVWFKDAFGNVSEAISDSITLSTSIDTSYFQNFLSYDGHIYALTNNTMTWDAARTLAAQQGGYLVSINDSSENQFLVDNNYASGTSGTWMGYNDVASEGAWMWVGGDTSAYTNWNSGEPNNYNNQDCGQIYSSGKWDDDSCSNAQRAIVEWVAPTFSITGKVVSSENVVMTGVVISLSGATSTTTTTDSSGIFTFSSIQNGDYTITPSKTDYTFAPTSISVTVNGANVVGKDFVGTLNAVPVISSITVTPDSLTIGDTASIAVVASDPEGDTLSYSYTATGGTVSGTTSTATYTAPTTTTGTYTIQVTVTDGKGGSATNSATVTVNAATIIYDDFSVLSGWTYDTLVSSSGAGFYSDGSYLLVNSWGSGTYPRGPVIYKDLSPSIDLLNDTFTVDFYLIAQIDNLYFDQCAVYIEFLDSDNTSIIKAAYQHYNNDPYFWINILGVEGWSGKLSHSLSGKVSLTASSGAYKLFYNDVQQATNSLTTQRQATKLRLGTVNTDSYDPCEGTEIKLDWLRLTKP